MTGAGERHDARAATGDPLTLPPRDPQPRARYDARAAGRLRRPGGPGRRAALPAQRHARPGHPRRAARGGGPPLPALRRGEPDQRAEPRAAERSGGRAGPPRAGPAGAVGQPQLGPLPRRRAARGARGRAPPPARGGDQRVLVVLELPAVPRGPRGGPGRDRADRRARGRQGPPVLRPPGVRQPVRRRHPRRGRHGARRAGPRRRPRRTCTCCSPRTRSRRRRRWPPGRRPPTSGPTGPTARSTGPSPRWSWRRWPAGRAGSSCPGPWSSSRAAATPARRGSSRTSTTRSASWPPRAPAAVVIVPLGFVSDHMEVLWDLDEEATADRAGGRARRGPRAHAGRAPRLRGRAGGPGRGAAHGRDGRRGGRCPPGRR